MVGEHRFLTLVHSLSVISREETMGCIFYSTCLNTLAHLSKTALAAKLCLFVCLGVMEKELMFCLNSHEIILPLSVIFLLKKFYLLFIVQNSIKIKDGT